MRTPAHFIVAAIIAGIIACSMGCTTRQAQQPINDEHYPYHGPLVDTNGIPVNPPRW
jgi:hypothetical protein